MSLEASLMVQVADALTAAGIPHMLAGSFSSNYYGIPLSTKDADFVLEPCGGVGRNFIERLGPDFEVDPQLSFETNTGTYRQLIQHRCSPFKVELFLLSSDRFPVSSAQERAQGGHDDGDGMAMAMAETYRRVCGLGRFFSVEVR